MLLAWMTAAVPSTHVEAGPAGTYPVHCNIAVSVFWVGEVAQGSHGPIENAASAWDEDWIEHLKEIMAYIDRELEGA